MKISHIIIPLSVIIALPCTAVSLWCVTFGFTAGYAGIAIIACGAFGAFLRTRKNAAVILPVTLVLWCAANTALLPLTIRSYNEARDTYIRAISSGGELGFREKCGIYGLNIVMSVCAYPFYPEAAKESILLMFPADGGSRRFKSGFFLDSRVVRNTLRGKSRNCKLPVRWNLSEYAAGGHEARYALALNPCELRVETVGGTIRYIAKVRVEYPDRAEAVLLRGPFEIRVEEGLFGYLQKRGWLHPYDAEWVYPDKQSHVLK